MRALLATTAVLGVLVAGGLPVGLTLAADEDDRPAARTAAPWDRGEVREPPPGWQKNHAGATPHGWEVREWARCRSGQRGAGKPEAGVAPGAGCGEKPAKQAKPMRASKSKPGKRG